MWQWATVELSQAVINEKNVPGPKLRHARTVVKHLPVCMTADPTPSIELSVQNINHADFLKNNITWEFHQRSQRCLTSAPLPLIPPLFSPAWPPVYNSLLLLTASSSMRTTWQLLSTEVDSLQAHAVSPTPCSFWDSSSLLNSHELDLCTHHFLHSLPLPSTEYLQTRSSPAPHPAPDDTLHTYSLRTDGPPQGFNHLPCPQAQSCAWHTAAIQEIIIE